MNSGDISFLAQVVRRRSGLVLPVHKQSLIEGRLATVMRRFGFRSVDALVQDLRHGRDTLARAVTEAMTTLARSRAKVIAQAAPIPDAPPVTIATLPSTWPIVSSLLSKSRYYACTISSRRTKSSGTSSASLAAAT